jgi:hypothetical protein
MIQNNGLPFVVRFLSAISAKQSLVFIIVMTFQNCSCNTIKMKQTSTNITKKNPLPYFLKNNTQKLIKRGLNPTAIKPKYYNGKFGKSQNNFPNPTFGITFTSSMVLGQILRLFSTSLSFGLNTKAFS